MAIEETWVNGYDLQDWNCNEIVENSDTTMVNRTNNPLERYNSTLQDAFERNHPSLETFVTTIKRESIRMVQKIEDKRNKHDVPPEHNDLNYPQIPDSYHQYTLKYSE